MSINVVPQTPMNIPVITTQYKVGDVYSCNGKQYIISSVGYNLQLSIYVTTKHGNSTWYSETDFSRLFTKVDLDKMYEEWVKMAKGLLPSETNSEYLGSEIECSHDYKPYIGFTEVYKFCTKCSHKVYE